MPVPAVRIRRLNDRPVAEGRYVLYWMTAFRRLTSNFALQHAVEQARSLRRPLVILEALRVDYRWASDRLHRFVLDGMAEHARALSQSPVTYLPYVEPAAGAGRGLIEALAREAAIVVSDDYPCFFLPRMAARAAALVPVPLDLVDSNGLLPMREAARTFTTAVSFRAYLQRTLPRHLPDWPEPLDLSDLRAPDGPVVAPATLARWPMARPEDLAAPARLLRPLPIDHTVAAVVTRGGSRPARDALAAFVRDRLGAYAEGRAHPDARATSRLSPWLHFGHLSAHEVFEAIMTAEHWTSRRLRPAAGGARTGWWGVSAGADAFLDQLVTWRELGFNMCVTRPDDYADWESLPLWARATLDRHAADRRDPVYGLDELERAGTHDPVWNAAQRELTRDGWMHNSLRMLWGKKILEWSASPRAALDTMIALMNRHALDGRDPNSYSGYAWTLGRYDRPWGPARPIFGTVRYMSSVNAAKKLRMRAYLREYGASSP